ncbi:bifunctional tetrahydrofolate synthase/dihydrofolate synthase [Mycolicibacterium mengxianglii]|uniref:bifunctional tetrahydrofolate synthase/dihydrofolate synthase n=1 Tax=Mycolicibacterium mengxianglii TaxID=2736649 RepID=UPI0018EEE8EC|nr:folylpolyglutamate synthase/dihydrofolate synthase family protein [Mycolicibacterium mengxianglii]
MTEPDFPDEDFPEHDAITPEAIIEPSPDEIAALLQVEHLLDQRWPETKIEPSTTRIAALMELLGSPQLNYPSIHIAGTNGKTSVARMIDALITALHQRTGRTTSPHLQSAVERISIDGKPVTPARYVEAYREIEPFVELVDAQSEAAGGPAMSKFEVVTAMAFAAFADAPVDVAIVEVGLGGRWDATNIVNASVAVITPVGVDHVEYLGSDIAGIAGEKAGIIKKADPDEVVPEGTDPSMVAIIAQQVPEAMEVIVGQAVQAEAAVAREGAEFALLSRQVAVGGQMLELQGLGGVYSEVFLPLHGEHQAHNAVVALAAVEAFFGAGASRQLDIDAVRAGFAAVASPGRLERLRNAPSVFIDAAHNPAGAAALAQSLVEEFDFRFLVGVISVMADKDVAGILAALEPVLDQVVVTHNGSPRALEVDALAQLAEERFGPERVITAATLVDAVETATALVEEAGENGGVSGTGIVITGSVVTAGAARTLFGKDPQ